MRAPYERNKDSAERERHVGNAQDRGRAVAQQKTGIFVEHISFPKYILKQNTENRKQKTENGQGSGPGLKTTYDDIRGLVV